MTLSKNCCIIISIDTPPLWFVLTTTLYHKKGIFFYFSKNLRLFYANIVFAVKYRRKVIYGKLKVEIGKIIIDLCNRKEVELIEAEACTDHIHILVSIPPKLAVSSFMGYLKGKSTLIIFEKHANLKYKYSNRNFWCRGYFVSTVGKNKRVIQEYIKNQLRKDIETDQITMKEFVDPFKDSK